MNRHRTTEAFVSGLVCLVVFTIIYGTRGNWIWLFPLVFAGVLPTVAGIRKFILARIEAKVSRRNEHSLAEREILRLANQEPGGITPALAALKTGIGIDLAERILLELTQKGVATMNITGDGRVIFDFPDFFHRDKTDDVL